MARSHVRGKKTQRSRRAVLKRLGLDIAPGRRIQLADGGFYRIRRGKLVRIPDEWVGKPFEMCGSPKKWRLYKLARTRQSKSSRKVRMRDPWHNSGRVPRERQAGTARGGKMGHPRNRSPRHLGRRDRMALDREASW